MITAHFEYFGEGVQIGQVNELLDGPVAVDMPLILLGDFNQTPGSPTWHLLNRRGFVDAWLVAGEGPGATSSQAANLRNEASLLGHRIDWILVRGPIEVEGVSRLGHRPVDRTSDGLWPSDHAGVEASLFLLGAPENLASRQAVAIMKALYRSFVGQDLEAAMALIDPDSHWSFPGDPAILPWAGNYRGSEIPRFLQACVMTLDYLEYVAHTFQVDGEVVTVRSNERCRVKRTGKTFRHDLTAVARVRDGKIVQFVEYGDTAAMQAAFIE